MSEHVGYKRPKTHYHPTEGYAYELDMTPTVDWWPVTHVVMPEGRFLNDDELWELFVLSHRLTPENIELMKKWDRDNNRKDRFKPRHSGFPEWRNRSLANSCGGSKEDKEFIFEFLTGKHSSIDYDFYFFKKSIFKQYARNQK